MQHGVACGGRGDRDGGSHCNSAAMLRVQNDIKQSKRAVDARGIRSPLGFRWRERGYLALDGMQQHIFAISRGDTYIQH